MGGGASKVFVANDDIEGQDTATLNDLINVIHLSIEEVNSLFAAFRTIDVSGDNSIDLVEFLRALNIEETPITKEVFSEFDSGKDQSMTFREFALNTWRYCTMEKGDLASFAFDIYDTDDSNALSVAEVREMIMSIHGSKGLTEQVNKALPKLQLTSQDSVISRTQFVTSAQQVPILLYPAFNLQDIMRKRICGEKFWQDKVTRARTFRNTPAVKELFKRQARRGKEVVSKKKRAGKSGSVTDTEDSGDSISSKSNLSLDNPSRRQTVHGNKGMGSGKETPSSGAKKNPRHSIAGPPPREHRHTSISRTGA